MFRRMFGAQQNGAGVSSNATGRTVDAIQKLGEVRPNENIEIHVFAMTLKCRLVIPPFSSRAPREYHPSHTTTGLSDGVASLWKRSVRCSACRC